jgi:hypothetical protein
MDKVAMIMKSEKTNETGLPALDLKGLRVNGRIAER